jgi:cyclophilin family peptidyl-prolyl cis-trans isomerase/HEAT repeat protein
MQKRYRPPFVIRLSAIVLLALSVQACDDGSPREVIGERNMFEDQVLVEMYTAADRRDAEALLTYANHETAAYRRAFARLVGSMTDSLLLPPLAALLSDPIPYVRLEAAWAIGQYRDTLALEYLETAIRKATIPEVKAELLESIGKCAHPRAMAFLLRHEPNTPVEEAGKMWAIYRATLRGMLEESHLRVVAAHLKSGDVDTRLAAANTLARQGRFRLDDYSIDLRNAAANDPSAEVRHMAVQALAYTETVDAFYAEAFMNDADPAVRSAAVLALRNPNEAPARQLLLDALEDGQVWTAMAAASRLHSLGGALSLEQLRNLALTSPVLEVRAAALSQVFRLTPNRGEAWQLYRQVMDEYPNGIARAGILRSMGQLPEAYDSLVVMLKAPAPISTAAAEAMVGIGGAYPAMREQVAKQLLGAIREGGTGPVAVFAEAALAPHYSPYLLSDSAGFRIAALRFTAPGEMEVYNALMRAYHHLRGTFFTPAIPDYNHPIDWLTVQRIPRQARARIHSGGRYLELQLLVEDAPGSVAGFVALAERGFYNGLGFHRIVPGFVSQGACPAGDGYHSVDYSLRSEFSSLRFGKGVVGLASSGKDTEGCQFFVTHVSTPHLDGRYTIFAAVSGGFDLVYDLGTGSLIDSVSLHMVPEGT